MFAVEFITSRPANAPAYYGLCAPGTYVLGRSSECHLAISSADISRQHLTMRVVLRDQIHEVLGTDALQNLADAFEDDEEPFITPIVLIVENRSQFGCRVDRIPLKNLGAQAAITSGGGSVYVGSIALRVTYRPVVVSVNEESFAPEFVEEVSEMYQKLGADVLAPAPQPLHATIWKAIDHVSKKAATHFELENFQRLIDDRPLPHVANYGAPPVAKFLVTNSIDASPQCLLGLAFGYTLVHPSFVFEFFASMAETCIEPLKNTPHPSKYEPQIVRAVFPTGGYARPEGRSLPFPLFPPNLDTPWFKSRHRLLSHCLAAVRDQDVASSLVEVVTAVGARLVNWGTLGIKNEDEDGLELYDPVTGKKKKKKGAAAGIGTKKSSGFNLDANTYGADVMEEESGSDDSDDDSEESDDTIGYTVDTGTEVSAAANTAARSTRSRGWSGGPRNLPPRGSRASDVDSATGEPLLLPHQIAKRQAAIEKKKKEMDKKLNETLEMNQAREETINVNKTSNIHASSHAIDEVGRNDDGHKFIVSPNPAKFGEPRRKLVILSPTEVSELSSTILSNSMMLPRDAQEHDDLGMNNLIQMQNNFNALLNNQQAGGAAANLHSNNNNSGIVDERMATVTPLQEDVLMYARRGWDIVSVEQLLHSLLTCEPLGPSLLEHLIAPPQIVTADGSVPRLTEKNLEQLQKVNSDHTLLKPTDNNNNEIAPERSGTQHPLMSNKHESNHQLQNHQNSNNNNVLVPTAAQQQKQQEQFTEKNSDMDSDRTPSDIDSNDAVQNDLGGKSRALMGMKPFASSSAGTTLRGGDKRSLDGVAHLPDESVSVTLQLDRTRATVLARLRKACERNVISYKNRLLNLKRIRDKPTSAKLDDDKLSVTRDALQSCETFLHYLEEAEEHMAAAEQDVEEKLRKAQEASGLVAVGGGGAPGNNNNNKSSPRLGGAKSLLFHGLMKNNNMNGDNDELTHLDILQRQQQESNTQHQFFGDAVEPLRQAAVEVAQCAYALLRKDEPSLSRAPHKWNLQKQQGASTRNFLVNSNFTGQQNYYSDPNEMQNVMEENIVNQTSYNNNTNNNNNNNNSYYESPQRGSPGNFSGMVQPWEKSTMKPKSNLEQFYGNDKTDNLLNQIDEELKKSNSNNRRNTDRSIASATQQQQQENEYNNRGVIGEANIHPLTNWVRYSPDIPTQVRTDDLKKSIIPKGVAIAPTFTNNNNIRGGQTSVNPGSPSSNGMRGGDLKGIADFRKSLIAQHGVTEGNLRFELWLGSQSSQWTMRFHSELEKRGLKFSEFLMSGQEALTK